MRLLLLDQETAVDRFGDRYKRGELDDGSNVWTHRLHDCMDPQDAHALGMPRVLDELDDDPLDDLEVRLTRLELQDGDRIVIECDHHLAREHAAYLKGQIEEALPGTVALIFDGRARLAGVLGRPAIAEAAGP